MEPEKNIDEKPPGALPRRAACVPRQYGVGTLLLITTMYAVLFALLQCLDAHVVVFLIVVSFTTCVGLGQMLLFKGESPRRASVLAGMGCFFVLSVGCAVYGVLTAYPFSVRAEDVWRSIIGIGVFTCIGGAFGYLSGGAIAGVFLIAEWIERPLAARRLRINEKEIAEDES